MEIETLIVGLFEKAKVIQFGAFTLKSGMASPVYVDMRLLASYPDLLKKCVELSWPMLENANVLKDVSRVCGVPYGAWPLATCISIVHNIPSILMRDAAKAYGGKKLIEGVYTEGDGILLVEDVVTTGNSVVEAVEKLRQHGLVVTDVLVLVDRQQGAAQAFQKAGVRMHSLVNVSDVLETLAKLNKISHDTVLQVQDFIASNNKPGESVENGSGGVGELLTGSEKVTAVPLAERAKLVTHPVSKRLVDIMAAKSTNLCVAADYNKTGKILQLAGDIGPKICALKLHADIVDNFNDHFVDKLKALAKEHNFLLFEDRKLNDIGAVADMQLNRGPTKPAKWANLLTVSIHPHSGPGPLPGIKEVCKSAGIGCLLLTDMSTKDSGPISDGYRERIHSFGYEYSEVVAGFVTQCDKAKDNSFLCFSPGIHLESNGDTTGQKWRSPQTAIQRDNVDVMIVGRGVTKAEDTQEAVEKYRKAGWDAYLESLHGHIGDGGGNALKDCESGQD